LTLPCKIWPELLGGGFLDRRGRKVGDWCVMVAATRGDSLSIPVQLWLKGNFPHIRKKELGDSFKKELTQRRKKIGKSRDSKSSKSNEKQEERRTEAKKRGENRLSRKETDREDCKR